MTASRSDVFLVLGDDEQLSLDVSGPLTGKRIELLVKPSSSSPDGDAIFQISSVDGAPPRINVVSEDPGEAVADLTDLTNTAGTFWYTAWVADVADPELDKTTFSYGAWTVQSIGSPAGVTTDSPCSPWPLDMSCWDLPEGDHSEVISGWHAYASGILWRLSGRRWGVCTQSIRPCLRRCAEHRGGRVLQPYLSGGVWRNWAGCGCSGSCSCRSLCEVRLPTPVNAIESVTIDGAVVDPADYRVDAPGWLVRQNGECWPSCQDMSQPAGAEGSFVVDVSIGIAPDEGAIQAVSAFTLELVKACIPSCKDCQLPKRVTQIVRQNMAAQFIDPQEFLTEGKTGIYVTDLWLASVNPNGMAGPGRVMSPDYQPPRKTVWTA